MQTVARAAGFLALWGLLLCDTPVVLHGQSAAASPAAPRVITIDAAIDLAIQNYPAVRAADGQVRAAREEAALAGQASLPHLELLWQENAATRNNVAGLLLPQGVVPSITGPVSTSASYTGVWGSAAGALFSWEPFDFGARQANVAAANSREKETTAGAELTRLEVAAAAADAFLRAVAADELVRAAEASVDRQLVLQRSVVTLVDNQLRPGADASRVEADLATARIQLIRSQRASALARIALAEALGLSGSSVVPDAGTLPGRLPVDAPAPPRDIAAHPAIQAAKAAVDTAHDRALALDKAYAPHIDFQSALSSRGAPPAGTAGAGTDGLFPSMSNWAAGVTVTFSVFDFASLRTRKQIEMGHEAVERAQLDAASLRLRTDEARAQAELDAAREIAASTPVALHAAEQAETQIRARYNAGLATLADVADSERGLTQADTDDRLARLEVWQALLAQASARGDLTPWLAQVKK
jgi:outer membrane protein